MSNKNDLDGVTPAKFSDDPGSAIRARKVPLLIGGGLLAVSLIAGGIVASTLPDDADTANNASVVDIQASEDEPDYRLEEVPALKERGMDKNVPGIKGIPGVQPKDIPPITRPSVADAPTLTKPSTKPAEKPKPKPTYTPKPTKEQPVPTKTVKPNPPKPTYTPPTKEPTYTPPIPTTTIPPITPTTTTPKPTTSKPTTSKPTTSKPTSTTSKPTTTTSKPTTSKPTTSSTKPTSTSTKPSEDPKSGPVVEYKVKLSGVGEFDKISYIDKNGKEKDEKTLKGKEWNLVQEFESGTPRAGVKVKGDGTGVVSCVVLVNGKEVARDIGVLKKDVKCEAPTEVVKAAKQKTIGSLFQE